MRSFLDELEEDELLDEEEEERRFLDFPLCFFTFLYHPFSYFFFLTLEEEEEEDEEDDDLLLRLRFLSGFTSTSPF